jgi:hypothetical protein
MQSPVEVVIYRSEQLPELVAAVILNHKFGSETINVPAKTPLPFDKTSGKCAVVYGSYYDEKAMEKLTKDAKEVTVHMYEVDARNRYGVILENCGYRFWIGLVDSYKRSYAGYTWERYMEEKPPRALELLDLKGRSNYKDDADVKPFIEWLYVTGQTFERVRDVLFTDKYDMENCIKLGSHYQKKSESLVGSICDAAGWYTMFSGKYKTACVDATRPIELVGEELCARGADIAIITRFDHQAKKHRYSLYTCNPSIIAVQVTQGAGYDAGGNHKISDFLTDESIDKFIAKNEVAN